MSEPIRVTHGVWRPAESVEDLGGRCRAMLAALPRSTVVAGLAAARLHGLWVPGQSRVECVDVILRGIGNIPHELPGSIRREIRGRRRQLRRDEVDIVDGVPVTSEVRTWIDLAESLCPADLVAAGDSVLRGGVSSTDLRRAITEARRRRGVVRARQVLPLLDGRSRSRPESHLRFILVDGGLPTPEVNRPIHDATGAWVAEPDLHYRQARLTLEYNGADHAKIERMRRDITRGVAVAAAEWLTLTFGPREVFTQPHDTVALVRAYLDARWPGWWCPGAA